ncbi:MAG: hypothetical protein ACHQQ3_12235 [Gemmatimonadales bacterium]
MASSRSSAWAAGAAAAVVLVSPVPIHAQVEREVRGTLSHVVGARAQPRAGAWVTLHRVGTDRSGPVDSMLSSPAGAYVFHYRATGDTSALYFVSTRFDGIAYFTSPLHAPVVRGEAADLTVYDTTSGPVPIHVQGRHIVVMAPDSGRSRRVVEVFELSNDSSVTRVAGAQERPTFETQLPDGARDMRAGNGEITGDALAFTSGRARVLAPIAPGVKQFSFNYRLDLGRGPMAFPSFAPASVLEVLIEDEQGTVSGAGLREAAAATLNGRRFRRFLAQEVRAATVIAVTAATTGAAAAMNPRIGLIVTAVGATLLVGLAGGMLRRGPSRARRPESDDPEELARQLSALDAAFGEIAEPTADERADHYEARARLTARRAAALARRDGPT